MARLASREQRELASLWRQTLAELATDADGTDIGHSWRSLVAEIAVATSSAPISPLNSCSPANLAGAPTRHMQQGWALTQKSPSSSRHSPCSVTMTNPPCSRVA